MIYLDNAATTRVFDCAISAAEKAMSVDFYNPNSTYGCGVAAKNNIDRSRRKIADIVGAQPNEIVFTSGATESNNWVFECGRKNPKGNIVISAGEHASVYECAMRLKSRGIEVRVVPLTRDGTVDINAFERAVDGETTLVSIIHVSNETGAVNPLKELVAIAKKRAPRALFHSDGVQSLLKIGVPIGSLGCDFYSASAHKLGAPKGVGFLYIRSGVNIQPFLRGGGQEGGLRSGTQNTPYIAAFASALEHFDTIANKANVTEMRSYLHDRFVSHGYIPIGALDRSSAYILCVQIPQVKAEVLQNALYDKGIVIGKGAACSGTKRGNRVLSAMGLSDAQAECCIRISLFADTKREDIVSASNIIIETAEKIRSNHVG